MMRHFFVKGRLMMCHKHKDEMKFRYVHLTAEFYKLFSHYAEMMKDENRQYIHLLAEFKGHKFVVPFRSYIKHKEAFIFSHHDSKLDKNDTKGLDYSKALIIHDIDRFTYPSKKNIPQHQHDLIMEMQDYIIRKFQKYVDEYSKMTAKKDKNYLRRTGSFSTLQNFHKELGIEQAES